MGNPLRMPREGMVGGENVAMSLRGRFSTLLQIQLQLPYLFWFFTTLRIVAITIYHL